MLDVLVEVVLPVLAVALAGGIVGRRLGFSVETLSKAVFFLFSPCLVFTSIANIDIESGEVGRLVLVAVAVFAVNAIAALVWTGARRTDRATRACALLTAAVANQGNMGLPMAKLAFGDAGLQIAVIMFVAGVTLWSSAGIALGSWARGTHSGRRALVAPFGYPAIYAAAAGTIVNATNVELPTIVRESTHTLGDASIPCMLVVLGLQFRRPKLDAIVEPLASTANRLLIGPLAAWPVAHALGMASVSRQTAIMLSGMPTAVMTTILATELDAKPDEAVTTVIVSTAISVLSLTVLITLLR